ncbi:Gfo/Idh/MocA family oxidoreductase [Phytoactinopolyspora alkaliphila]|uniref:Gfo/Idh/MocA family oxidoreductase n=1 Tax=Phytoactinopolyspora alkaliphila TaxID=1783498 RepID=A0A6N9YQ77_9ACTN|nr:Gfo/Idh/MocA family oxidoreductase [Phytoactinopolyspora alkaliphila]NED97095.1 Gfo/Idh/MocA family oxidoreductase [Phytoactinopolyspora alkaliphila]
MSGTSGASYTPEPVPDPVVGPGEFVFAAAHLDHGHIYGMCEGVASAGGTLRWVYDRDPAKVEAFRARFPDVRVARSEDEVLDDPEVRLVAGAAVTSERCALGLRVIGAGKDYFTDKAPLTTLEQLEAAREATTRTGLKYAVYYSERIHAEAAVLAGQLIEQGAIGRVLQVMGLGPHRLGTGRPDWFFEKDKYGGILCDIGSHNFEQMLYYAGAKDGEVAYSAIANYHHPEHPGLDDFGEATIVMDNSATGYCRVDWFTPDGLSTWGDGRTFILGTNGYIELRKYVNVGTDDGPGHVFLVNDSGEHHLVAHRNVGYPYFGHLILDCLERTETAMTQEHAFKAAELSVRAQLGARVLTPWPEA